MASRVSEDSFPRRVLGILFSAIVVLVFFSCLFPLLISRSAEMNDVARRDSLVQMVTLARNAIDPIVQDVRAGRMGREQGIAQARSLLRQLTYSDSYGPNYVFMSAYDGTMLVQPFEPQKEMTSQWELRDDHGTPIIQQLIAVAKSPEGRVFFTYFYPALKSGQSEEKQAFVIGIPELECYVGTGMYMNQHHAAQRHLFRMAHGMSLCLLVFLLIQVLWSIYHLHARNRSFAQEVLARKKTENELREREETFRALTENSLDVIMRFDKELRHLYVNPSVERLTGIPPEQFLGKTHEELGFPAALRQQWEVALRAVFREGKVNRIDFQLPNGSWIDWLLVPERSEDGSVHAVLAAARDITDRRLAEQALRETEERYRIVFEASNDAIIISQWETLLDCNAAALRVYGAASREELVTRSATLLSPPVQPDGRPSAQAAASYMKACLSGVPQRFEWEHLRMDGTPFSAEVTLNAIQLANESYILSTIRDITERKRAEREMRTLALLVEHSSETVNLARLDGRMVFLNAAGRHMLGIEDDELASVSITDAIPEHLQDAVMNDVVPFLLQGNTWEGELQYRNRKTGEIRDVYVMAFAIQDPVTGQTEYLANVSRDITEHKRAEAALRKSEARFRTLFSRAPMGLAYITLDGRLIDVNDEWLRHLGYSKANLTNLDGWWSHAYPDPEYRQHVMDVWSSSIRQAIETGTDIEPHEFRVTRQDGVCRTLLIGARLLERNVLASYLDITDRTLAEEALQASEGKLRSLFAAMTDTILVLDAEGRYLEVAPTNADLLHHPGDGLIGRTLTEIFPPELAHLFMQTIHDTLREGKPVSLEYDLVVEERTVWFSAHVAPLSSDRVILVARDVTERKLSEMERERLQAQLLQSQKMEAVGQLAGGVAHDFNNMLQAILGYIGLVQDETDPESTLGQYLEEAHRAAERSANLTRQLLAFARKQTVAPVVLDLNESVESMLKMLRRLIGEDIELRWRPHSGLWPVKMDPAQIDQVLANLCVNARDAIRGVGTITIETGQAVLDEARCREHGETAPGDYVLLEVTDDGCGMDPETLDKVFEPFFTTKGLGEGTGLGLATVYGIVKQNDGFVEVYSEPGEGTRFKVYLPRYHGPVPGTTESPVGTIPLGQGETILLVEDEPAILNMASTMLRNLGYVVLAVNTPSEAIRLAQEHPAPIALLITDVVMPDMNGRDLAERFQILRPVTKCLFMSGYTANVMADRNILSDDVQFIQKPFSRKDLAFKIREMLEQE